MTLRKNSFMLLHLPEFSAMMIVMLYIYVVKIPVIISFLFQPFSNISLATFWDATFMAVWAAIIGWGIRYFLDTIISSINKNKPK